VLKVCGTAWQAAYSSAHAAWSQDGHTTRALVFEVRGTSGGLADRLTGMMTALLLAILTDRAFQLDWPEHTVALQTPRIDSTGLLPALGRTPPAEVRRVTWINGDRIKLAQLTAELDHLWPERVVRLQSNRGFTQALLEQHAAAAARRQLTRNSTQFGCLLNFLFEPTPATLGPYTALIARLSDATRPVVAVHVRTGDRAFDVTTAASLQAQGAAERAEHERALYEAHRFILDFALRRAAAHSPPARLLLLSDSVALRRAAARQLGEIVLNPPAADLTIGHIARGGGRVALRSSVAEHWLYSAATEFVYSSHSGFPRTAAARAVAQDAIYTCFHYEGPLFSEKHGVPRPKRECSGPYSVFELGVKHAAGL